MGENILFSETQRFRQWWIWVLILGVDALFLYGFLFQVVAGGRFGDKPMSDAGLIIAIIICLAFTLLFYNLSLRTTISAEGIHVWFSPIQRKGHFYPWEKILKSYVRKYSPFSEFGGWGVRYGRPGKGKALNVSGNMGLQLEFANGKKLLIGTRKPDEITSVLSRTGRLQAPPNI